MHRRKRARRPMRPVLFDRHAKCRVKLPVILVNKLRPRTLTRSVIKPDMRITVGLPGAFYSMKKLKGLHPLWDLLAERIPCIGACSWCESPFVRHGHRFPAEVIAYAVWLYFRFPLSMRMVEDILTVRGITVIHEMIRRIETRSYVWRERALSYQIRFTTSRTPVSGRTVMDMVGIGKGCVPSSKRKRATRVARMM
jgi:hypothetical protein